MCFFFPQKFILRADLLPFKILVLYKQAIDSARVQTSAPPTDDDVTTRRSTHGGH